MLQHIKLFIVELNILSLVSICFQNLNEIFLADKGLPILIVTEVRATVINGTITTIKEKIETNIVRGVLHFPKSTIVGLVHFPLIVINCFFPSTNVEKYKTKFAIIIKNTAKVVASIMPSSFPI